MGRDRSLEFYPKDYVVVDIETTGLSAANNEIIELSALKVINGTIQDQFSKLIKPNGEISPFITNLTGITPGMLKNADDITNTLPEFINFCQNSIILGHNIKFDLRFINTNLLKHFNKSFNNDYVDTLKIAREFLPQLQSRKLGFLAKHFNFDSKGMHRGLKDCIITNLCYNQLLKMKKQKDIN